MCECVQACESKCECEGVREPLQDELVTPGSGSISGSPCLPRFPGWFGLTRLCVWGPGPACRVTLSLSTSPASAGLCGRSGSPCASDTHTYTHLVHPASPCERMSPGHRGRGDWSPQRTLPHSIPHSLCSQRAQGSG